MSQTVQANTGQAGNIKTDNGKIFLWNNRFDSGLFDEPAGSGEYTLNAGQLIGRIASSGKLKICAVASTDGSQFPIGVVAQTVVMAQDATDVSVSYCVMGDVAEEKVLLSGAETLNSVVTVSDTTPTATTYTRRLRDLVQQAGIRLVVTNELTAYDNDL